MRIKKVSETTPITGNVINGYSESTQDGYACDYINGLHVYSTEETVVGTWIDGKPLYRKVVDIGVLPNNDVKKVNTGLSNILVKKIYGTGNYIEDNVTQMNLPYANPDDITKCIELTILNKGSYVRVTTKYDYSRFSGFVILEYTKTTD